MTASLETKGNVVVIPLSQSTNCSDVTRVSLYAFTDNVGLEPFMSLVFNLKLKYVSESSDNPLTLTHTDVSSAAGTNDPSDGVHAFPSYCSTVKSNIPETSYHCPWYSICTV